MRMILVLVTMAFILASMPQADAAGFCGRPPAASLIGASLQYRIQALEEDIDACASKIIRLEMKVSDLERNYGMDIQTLQMRVSTLDSMIDTLRLQMDLPKRGERK